MRNLTLGDMKLGLHDLLDKRNAALLSTKTGAIYAPMLVDRRKRIDALPPALTGGAPLAEQLAETDSEHDGFGGAVWFLTEAYKRAPTTSPATLAAVERIRQGFIPALGDLQYSYATEADAALARKPLLKTHKADLELFPIEGGTLYDWAVGFLDAGVRLHDQLSARADEANAPTRKDAASLRGDAIGLLSRLRASLGDEVKHDKKLPRDLDTQLFGYLDQLDATRAAAHAAKKSGAKPPAPPPPKDG